MLNPYEYNFAIKRLFKRKSTVFYFGKSVRSLTNDLTSLLAADIIDTRQW